MHTSGAAIAADGTMNACRGRPVRECADGGPGAGARVTCVLATAAAAARPCVCGGVRPSVGLGGMRVREKKFFLKKKKKQ